MRGGDLLTKYYARLTDGQGFEFEYGDALATLDFDKISKERWLEITDDNDRHIFLNIAQIIYIEAMD